MTKVGDKVRTIAHSNLTVGSLVLVLSAFSMLAGVMGAVHTYIVLPQMDSRIQSYAERRGFVTREELNSRLAQIQAMLRTLATSEGLHSIEKRLDRMDERLRTLERRDE